MTFAVEKQPEGIIDVIVVSTHKLTHTYVNEKSVTCTSITSLANSFRRIYFVSHAEGGRTYLEEVKCHWIV